MGGQDARTPAASSDYFATSGWLSHFPEIAADRGVPQDPDWHPEGDVEVHTMHVVNAAAQYRRCATIGGRSIARCCCSPP